MTVQIDNILEQIEESNKRSQVQVDLLDSLVALQKNKDFNKVINEGYLLHEAANKVRCLASPALQGEQEQKEIMNALQGIGHLAQYFSAIYNMGNAAAKSIKDADEYREQLLSGEIDLEEEV